MKNKSYAYGVLLAVFVIAIGVIVYVATIQKSRDAELQQGVGKVVEVQKEIPAPDAELSFETESMNVSVGEEFSVPVIVNTKKSDVYNVDLYIEFDTDILEYVSVQPGTFFTEPMIFQEVLRDNILYYAFGSITSAMGSGELVVLTFRPIASGATDVRISDQSIIPTAESERMNNVIGDPLAVTVL